MSNSIFADSFKLQWANIRKEHLTFAWMLYGGSPRTHFLPIGDYHFNSIILDEKPFQERKCYSMNMGDGQHLSGCLEDVFGFSHLSLDSAIRHSFTKTDSSFNKYLEGNRLEHHNIMKDSYFKYLEANEEPTTPKQTLYTEEDARELYLCVRQNNQSISDTALDTMYQILKDGLK
jgi:hypothetical protein